MIFTRSKQKEQTSLQEIFTNSSQSWMANKLRRGAMIYYKCQAIQKNGVACCRVATQDPTFQFLDTHYCTQHAQLVLLKQRM